jgi:hypothetical protein
VRFDNAFVQSGTCGPAGRAHCAGRCADSHGATFAQRRTAALALAGWMHVLPDAQALARFGIETESERGALPGERGFVVVDGFGGHSPPGSESGHAEFLRAHGSAPSPRPARDPQARNDDR